MRYIQQLVFISLCTFFSLFGQNVPASITAETIKADIRFLASDELQGRLSGTPGNQQAASYVADALKASGLKPAGDSGSFFQSFEFVSSLRSGPSNNLVIEGPAPGARELRPEVDFRPLGFSTNATITAPLVFAGYGISAPDAKYDDFENVSVTGKIVVVLRYSPDGSDPHSDLNKYTALRNKARIVRDKGAAALAIVTGPNDDPDDDLIKLAYDNAFASSGIPAISIKRSALEPLFKAAGHDLKAIQDSIKATRKPVTFEFRGATATLQTDIEPVKRRTANVVGILEGHDPVLKNQVVIIGAHFDHLGYGGPGSGSLAPDTVAIHHGADDNASGTAGLLALARAFGPSSSSLKRTLLFLGFSGEELGTLGSAYYVDHPRLPLEQTVVMVNLDMVGRLQNRALTIYGTGSSPAWPPLLARENADSTFQLKEIADGYGPSDQAQFYGKDLPVLFFFTGTHNDYHKPSDTWEKINYPGEESIVRYIYRVVNDVQSMPERPAFTKTASIAPTGGDARSFSVTLGIIPDYGETQNGMKVGGVRPNGPAEKAGLKPGDIIVKMAGKKVMNIYDYMAILGELRPGDEAEVEVTRDGKIFKTIAKMVKRN